MAMLLPFVYFFMNGRMVAGIVSLAVCAVSLPLMIFVVGFFLYGMMAAWAMWGVRVASIEAHAARTAQKTAEAFERAAQKRAQQNI